VTYDGKSNGSNCNPITVMIFAYVPLIDARRRSKRRQEAITSGFSHARAEPAAAAAAAAATADSRDAACTAARTA
jgi:hypothetical protein